MSLVVTGATGGLGRLVVRHLLERGVPAEQIVAGGRRTEQLKDLADTGVDVRRIDYEDPASLAAGFAGARRVLLVSGTDFGRRVAQHTAAATAARDAGAELVAYTSAPYADTTSMLLAAEHRGTEEAIRGLGVPFAFLRNGWYFENYTAQIPTYLALGAVVGAAGEGRISAAARTDLAEAAAVVLAGDGFAGSVLELGGDSSFTLAELAAAVAQQSGQPVDYREVSQAELAAVLAGAGVPQPMVEILVDVDRAIGEGALEITSGDLHRLLGRAPATLASAVAEALA